MPSMAPGPISIPITIIVGALTEAIIVTADGVTVTFPVTLIIGVCNVIASVSTDGVTIILGIITGTWSDNVRDNVVGVTVTLPTIVGI
mgnify:CR=1 FL=1